MPSKVTLEIKGHNELDNLLKQFSQIDKFRVLDKAVGKAGKVVASRARQLAPHSRSTGTEAKQSASSRAQWPHALRDWIKSKVVKYAFTRVAVIGAEEPEGNAAHFIQDDVPREHIAWGKKSLGQYRAERDFVKQAFDETKQQQSNAIFTSLNADLDKMAK